MFCIYFELRSNTVQWKQFTTPHPDECDYSGSIQSQSRIYKIEDVKPVTLKLAGSPLYDCKIHTILHADELISFKGMPDVFI